MNRNRLKGNDSIYLTSNWLHKPAFLYRCATSLFVLGCLLTCILSFRQLAWWGHWLFSISIWHVVPGVLFVLAVPFIIVFSNNIQLARYIVNRFLKQYSNSKEYCKIIFSDSIQIARNIVKSFSQTVFK